MSDVIARASRRERDACPLAPVRHSVPSRRNTTGGVLGVLQRAFSSCGLWMIWALEAVNFLVHVLLRPTPWNGLSTSIGYCLWGLQLASLFVFQAVDPGMASPEWEEGAQSGKHSATVCKRTGKLLPARAMYVRRAGGVVLGVDHFCGWTGTPVGLYNRKLFVLFVCYSAVFCAMGASHSLYALLCALPGQVGADDPFHPAVVGGLGVGGSGATSRLPPSPPLAQCWQGLSFGSSALSDAIARRSVGAAIWEGFASLHIAFGCLLHLLGHAYAAGHLLYAVLLTGTVPANLLATAFLSSLAIEQVRLISKNRTTLDPANAAYDLGLVRNWKQWFGEQPLLWPLPVPAGVASDGYEWPLNPQRRLGGVEPGPHPLSARAGPSMRMREKQAKRFVTEALATGGLSTSPA